MGVMEPEMRLRRRETEGRNAVFVGGCKGQNSEAASFSEQGGLIFEEEILCSRGWAMGWGE